ncbi:MAG: hypothetical protein ACXWT4_01895, partial [Methylobacter sp.]
HMKQPSIFFKKCYGGRLNIRLGFEYFHSLSGVGMQDRRSSVSESVLVEVFFVGKAVFRNAGALRTAFPRRSVGTIIKFLFTT